MEESADLSRSSDVGVTGLAGAALAESKSLELVPGFSVALREHLLLGAQRCHFPGDGRAGLDDLGSDPVQLRGRFVCLLRSLSACSLALRCASRLSARALSLAVASDSTALIAAKASATRSPTLLLTLRRR